LSGGAGQERGADYPKERGTTPRIRGRSFVPGASYRIGKHADGSENGLKVSLAVVCTAEHPVTGVREGGRGPSGIRVLVSTTEWWSVSLLFRTCFHSWGFV